MSFTADRMCSSPGQTWRFPGDGLSHSDPEAQECRGSCGQRSPQREGGRASGREGTGVVVGTSLVLIPCVKSVTALEF